MRAAARRSGSSAMLQTHRGPGPIRCAAATNMHRPVGWEAEIDELRRREALARELGGAERVERQHASGRLTVRERIDRLLDVDRSTRRARSPGVGDYDSDGELSHFRPANVVVGQGRIEGRRRGLQGDDFTVRGGAADAAIFRKAVYAERLANELRIPLVRLVDGTGGGGSVKQLEQLGFTYVPEVPGWELAVDNLSSVPVVAAALGPCAGLGAARVVASHFSVIVRGTAQLFVAGPPVVAMAGWARRRTRRSSAERGPRPPRARSTTRPSTRRTRSRSCGASSPICRAASGRPPRAWPPPIPRIGARRNCSRSSRATSASPTTCGASSSSSSTAARCSRSARASGGR